METVKRIQARLRAIEQVKARLRQKMIPFIKGGQ